MAVFSAKAWFRNLIKPYLTIIKSNFNRKITSGTAAPTGGNDGDIYLQHTL
jgi:hypothetical protein